MATKKISIEFMQKKFKRGSKHIIKKLNAKNVSKGTNKGPECFKTYRAQFTKWQ